MLLTNVLLWQWTQASPADAEITGRAELGWCLVNSDTGRIAATGKAGNEPEQEDAVVDGGGALALPGLVDSHIHVAGLGESMAFLQLGGCNSVEALQEAIHARSADRSLGDWLQGTGWDQDCLGRYPTRHDLDAACSDRPVLLWRACWHIVVCNSKALQLAGLLDASGTAVPAHFSQQPSGGLVDMDAAGMPTGILRESAVDLVVSVTAAKSFEQKLRCVQRGLSQCLSYGLTSVQTNDERCMRVYRHLRAQNALPIRCFVTPTVPEIDESFSASGALSSSIDYADLQPGERLQPMCPQALRLSRQDNHQEQKGGKTDLALHSADSKLCVERVKIFSDGSLGAETAAIRRCAVTDTTEAAEAAKEGKGGKGGKGAKGAKGAKVSTSDAARGPAEHTGVLIHDDDVLAAQMAAVRQRGFRLEVHAIGDAAAEHVLAAMETAGVVAVERPVLTHCQVLGADLYKMMAHLGVVANIQPSFVPTDMKWVKARLSPEHISVSYPWKTLLYTPGITCAGGSDAPIETANPLEGMYDAIEREARDSDSDDCGMREVFRAEERLSFAEALWVYTIGGALASETEGLLGRLEPGYAADIILVRPDVLECTAALKAVDAVKAVFVGGHKMYSTVSEAAVEEVGADVVTSPPAPPAMGGPFQPGKNGRRSRNPWAKCACCIVR